jgi:hypothetical protein
MSDSRWIEDVEELLARSLGPARPTPDFASWRRRYIEAPPAIRARTNDWPADGPARGRTAGAASWLADHRMWSTAAAILVAVLGVSAYWLLRECGGGPAARPDLVGNSAAGDRMPVVFDTRGLVMALPDGDRKEVRLTAGSAVPAGRTLWTCPWGSSSVRYADGTSVTLDRSTMAVFSEAADSKRVSLKDGILFVTRRPSPGVREQIFVDAPQASIAIDQGEVALVANGDQTIVEVAVGKAQVKGATDNKTITLSAGEYALVRPGKGLLAVHGRLQWKLETADRHAE